MITIEVIVNHYRRVFLWKSLRPRKAGPYNRFKILERLKSVYEEKKKEI